MTDDFSPMVDDFREFVRQDAITLHRDRSELVEEYESIVRQYNSIVMNEGRELGKELSGEEKLPTLADFICTEAADEIIEKWREQNSKTVKQLNQLANRLESVFADIESTDDESIDLEGNKAGDIAERLSTFRALIQMPD